MTKAAATLQKKQEEEEVAAAAAALAAATPPPPPTTTTAATVTPQACTTTDDPIIPVVLGFGSSDDDDFAGDFAGDGEKKKQDDTVKAIADAAVKAGTVAKETQGDEEAAFVDDDITGNGDIIHPILRCKIPWDKLDPTLKGHMEILGFNRNSWTNKEELPPGTFLSKWNTIDDKAQTAAAAFGCDESSWNNWERSVFEAPKLCIIASEGNNDKGTAAAATVSATAPAPAPTAAASAAAASSAAAPAADAPADTAATTATTATVPIEKKSAKNKKKPGIKKGTKLVKQLSKTQWKEMVAFYDEYYSDIFYEEFLTSPVSNKWFTGIPTHSVLSGFSLKLRVYQKANRESRGVSLKKLPTTHERRMKEIQKTRVSRYSCDYTAILKNRDFIIEDLKTDLEFYRNHIDDIIPSASELEKYDRPTLIRNLCKYRRKYFDRFPAKEQSLIDSVDELEKSEGVTSETSRRIQVQNTLLYSLDEDILREFD